MAQDSGNQAQSNANDQLFMLIAAVGIPVLFWFMMHDKVVHVMFAWWSHLMGALTWLSPDMAIMKDRLAKANPAKVTFEQMVDVGMWIGSYTRWVISPALIAAAVYIYRKSPLDNHNKEYNMDSLLKSEVRVWPHVAPVMGLNLIKQDIDGKDGSKWAMGQTEFSFILQHNLWTDGALDLGKAKEVFSKQLGPMLTKLSAMKPERRAICALFLLRLTGDMDNFKKLRGELALFRSKMTVKPNPATVMAYVDSVLAKHKEHPVVLELTQKHAYETTFLTSLFQKAKKGVFPPNEILWLKPVDRTLWYALHQEGLGKNKVAWVEAAGIRAHWMAEVTVGRAIEQPTVSAAVTGLHLETNEDSPRKLQRPKELK